MDGSGQTGRALVLMGSGETSPTMVTVHREVVAGIGSGPVRAALLDTPYAFQENAADISARAQAYFRRSVGLDVDCLSGLGGAPAHGSGAGGPVGDRALTALRAADWVFCGPGSPTYALGYWLGTPAGAALGDLVRTGSAAVVFASAAVCTLGRFAVPVYEIYKVGAQPAWAPGLDLLAHLGVDVAVIPHYDNAEGGTHDTRYAYLGERRLVELERELPAGAAVLGLDEHTAAVFDRAGDTVEVRGRGAVTVRRAGRSVVLPAGTRISLDELRGLVSGVRPAPAPAGATGATGATGPAGAAAEAPPSLKDVVLGAERRFDASALRRDMRGMAASILEIDSAIAEWGDDTEEDEGGTAWARAAMRSLVMRLADLAATPPDPAAVLAPAMDQFLDIRDALRRSGRYDAADDLRAALGVAGIDVRDTVTGPTWSTQADRS